MPAQNMAESISGMHRRRQGIDHALGIHVRSKDPDRAVDAAERFQSLEHRLPIVQTQRSRVHRNWCIGDDFRIPPTTGGILAAQHMIGKDVTESQIVEIDIRKSASSYQTDR